MKRFIAWIGLSLVLLLGVSFAQDSAKQDMKDAGHETKEAAKDTGRATKKTAKKAGHQVEGHAQGRAEDGGRREKVEDKQATVKFVAEGRRRAPLIL